MKKITHTFFLLMITATLSLGQGFITTWEVTNGDLSIAIPTTGTGYNYTVKWGDGNTEPGFTGNASHTYASAGVYSVEITGAFPRIYFNYANTGNDRLQIKTIEHWGNNAWTSMEKAFSGCTQLTYNATDTPDLSIVEDMSYMFGTAVNFNGNINDWDISNVVTLAYMFENAQKFNQDLSGWNTSNVQSMTGMFWKAFDFNQDISSWDLSNVSNVSNMFKEASDFNQDLSGWNMSNVTLVDAMFQSSTSFNQDISGWDVSHFIRFGSMFSGATSFNQDISNWDVTGANSFTSMFAGATSFNQDISNWDVSNITNMFAVFSGATSFDQDLGTWDISNATNMTYMLSNSGLSISNYDNTLLAWAALPTVQSNINLGATGLSYCSSVDARTSLLTNFNWTFTDDTPDCPSFNTTWLTGAAGELVTIPTVGTGYDYYVDWGDGNIDYNVTGNASHNFATPGTHTIKIYGDFPRIHFNNVGHLTKIRSIEQWGDNQWETMENAFYGCYYIQNNATDAPDLSQVTSLAGMFRNATNFNSDLSNWDVSNVTNMANMLDNSGMAYFNYDQTLTGWAALPSLQSNVTLGASDVPYCDSETTARNTLINSKNWTLVGDKKGCPFITTWETNASKQVIIPVTGSGYNYFVEWGDGTNSRHYNSPNAQHTYATAGTYTVKISGNFPRFNGVAYANTYIKTIEQWGDIEWASMYRAFRGCSNLTSNATDAPDLSNVQVLSEMFYGASSFNADLSNWDVSNVTGMLSIFQNASSFNGDVSTWDVMNVGNMNSIFSYATSFSGDVSQWNVSNVTLMSNMFSGASSFNSDISSWDVSNVTNMVNMFRGTDIFNQPIGNWDVSMVTNMSSMFLDAHAFNQDLSNWDVAMVTDMSEMFNSAYIFNQPIGNWDVSNVTSMSYMFSDASAFNQPIGDWDLSNTLGLEAMFYQATSFNQDISNWDLSNGPDAYEMFYGATSFNQDISGWDVSNVSDLEGMFTGATSFNQNLSTWDVSNIEYMDNMFDDSGMSVSNYDQTLIGWAAQALQNNVTIGVSGLDYCLSVSERQSIIDNFSWTFVGDAENCIVYIPDANFKAALLANASINTTDDGEISYDEAEAFTGTLNVSSQLISDLTGIEAFTGITSLNCYDNLLVSLDLSSNTNLIDINCRSNQLASINVSGLTALENFDFANNLMTTINVTTNSGLLYLGCNGNQLTQLNISNNIALEDLGCYDNQLTSIDISANTSLKFLEAYENQLTSVNAANGNNAIIEIFDVRDNSNLTCISVDNVAFAQANFTDIDVIANFSTNCSNVENDILTFSFAEQTSAATIDAVAHTIVIEVTPGTSRTSITPTFTVSAGATSNPPSGVVQDFNNQFLYTVTAENPNAVQNWAVNVSEQNVAPTDINLSSSTINENNIVSAVVGLLSAIDGNASDVHTFSLVAGTGDADNASFEINAASLSAKIAFDFESKSGYSIRVKTTDLLGSSFEKVFTITIADLNNAVQSITFTQPGNVTYGDPVFQLVASSSSGLPVSLASSDPTVISIAGSTVTIVSAGSVTITASQAGDLDYAPAIDVSHIVLVNKKNQTITFTSLSAVTIGAVPFDLTATASSGLVLSYISSNTNVATVANATTTIVGAGTSTITASQAGDANHNAATSITQDLIVNKMTQTIMFSAIDDQLLEDGSLMLSATASSGLIVAFEVVSGPASLTGTELSFAGTGAATIKAIQVGNDTFLPANVVEQSFEISTITGLDESKNSIAIYPNPASDFLHIQLNDPDHSTIHLKSTDGRSVMTLKKAQEVIDVSSLPNGIYIIKIISPQHNSTHKFIKN